MDSNHYKQRPGETNATMAARALGLQSSKDLKSLFDPTISVGPDRHRLEAFQDNRNPDRIATVATSTAEGFTYNERGYRYARPSQTTRATVSTMTRKEWNAAYDRAEESTRPAYAEGDGHFVQALMNEVRAAKPGYAHMGPQYVDDYYADQPSNEFQPRAPGRIKAAAAAAAAKQAQPEAAAKTGPKKARDDDQR